MIEQLDRPTDPETVRRGCRARGWTLQPRFVFASLTVEAAPTPGVVWINVGTCTGSGIANFRAPASGVRGSCESVLRLQSELFAHVFAGWDGPAAPPMPPDRRLEVTICLPESFRPDDAAAACLVQRLLMDGELPAAAPALAAYMAWGRQSAEPYFPAPGSMGDASMVRRVIEDLAATGGSGPEAPIPLALAMAARHWRCMAAHGDRKQVRRRALAELVELFGIALDSLPGGDLTEARAVDRALADASWGRDASASIHGDVRGAMQFLLDFDGKVSVSYCDARLCGEDADSPTELVRALVVDCQEQADEVGMALLRFAYAIGLRNDADGTRPAIVVLHRPTTPRGGWYEISLAVAESMTRRGSLRRLGLALEALEQQRRASSGDSRRELHGRYPDIPGIADPWYDGRDHEYRIIGGPRRGEQSWLTIDDVKTVLASAYWQAGAERVTWWRVRTREQRADPSCKPDTSGIYRERERVDQAGTGDVTWRYQAGAGAAPRQVHGYIRRDQIDSQGPGLPIRPEPCMLRDGLHPDETTIVIVELARPPFMSRDSTPTVEQCIPAPQRDRWRGEACGPGARTVELDAHRVADVGPRGIVVWQTPGSPPDPDGGERIALAAMDVLAYRLDLGTLVREASLAHANDSRTAAKQLESFVEIVRSYHPERTGTDLRRVCEALEDSLSVPAVIERLERFLQFTDERSRIRHERKMQVVLLVLALPALIQTPADVLQAWSAREWNKDTTTGPVALVVEFAGWWTLELVVLLVAAIAAAYALYCIMQPRGPRVQGTWSRPRESRMTGD